MPSVRRRAIVPAALAAFLLVPLAAGLPEAREKQDSVTLKFNWPSDLRAKVKFEIRKVRKGGGQTRNSVVAGRYTMRTATVGDGLRISAHDGAVDVSGAQRPRGRGASMQDLMAELLKAPPSFVVNSGGEFRRIEGAAELQARLRRTVEEMARDLPPEHRARFDRTVAPMMSEAGLAASAANGWNREVGVWLGASFDLGDLYEARSTAPFPLLANRRVPTVTTFKFIRRLPCHAGESTARCVELEMRNFPDEAGLKKALGDFVRQMAGNANAPVFKTLKTSLTVRVVTEPHTLLPHSVTSRKETRLVLSMQGREIPTEQTEETRTVYTY